jgi:hypothetical protein
VLEYTVKGEHLRLSGTLSKVRVLPGLPQRIVVSQAKLPPPDQTHSIARSARLHQPIVEVVLPRNGCISKRAAGCDILRIQVVDAWGNHINQTHDLRHYELIIESSASESKLQTSFDPRGDAVIALSRRDDTRFFLADGSAMGIGMWRERLWLSI